MPLGIFDSLFPFVFLGCLVIGGGGGLLSTSRRLGELEILLVFLAMDSLSVAWAHMPLGRGVSPNSQDNWCFWVQMPLVPDLFFLISDSYLAFEIGFGIFVFWALSLDLGSLPSNL